MKEFTLTNAATRRIVAFSSGGSVTVGSISFTFTADSDKYDLTTNSLTFWIKNDS